MDKPNFGLLRRQASKPHAPPAPVRCCECNTIHQYSHCPECGEVPREALVSVLYAEVETDGGARLAVTAERAEADDGWAPVDVERVGDLDHGTRWGPS